MFKNLTDFLISEMNVFESKLVSSVKGFIIYFGRFEVTLFSAYNLHVYLSSLLFCPLLRVSVVQADGSYGLERGSNRGDAGHVFRPGDELSSNANKFPSTASYQGGNIAGTGIRIFDIREIKQNGQDTVMKFSVLFDGDTMPPSAIPTAFPTMESPEPELFSREIGE